MGACEPDGPLGMVAVCAACRDSKVKCEPLDNGEQCARCTRLGLVCSPAPPSQRGKRSSLSQLGPRNKQRLAGGAGRVSIAEFSSTEVNRAAGAEFACTWAQNVLGPGVMANTRHLAIQKAARARLYNRPEHMVHSMGLCIYFGFNVEEIISSSHKPAPIPSTIDDYPDAMAAMLRTSSGYATARCATGGAMSSVTNASFEAAVLSKHDLDTLANDPETCCQELYGFARSSYIHANDVHVINKLVQRLFAIEQAEHVVSVNMPELVRIVDWRLRCYVPCSVHGMIRFSALRACTAPSLALSRLGPRHGFPSGPAVCWARAISTCRACARSASVTELTLLRMFDSPCAALQLRRTRLPSSWPSNTSQQAPHRRLTGPYSSQMVVLHLFLFLLLLLLLR